MTDERAETARYLRNQHAAILKRVEHYTTSGNGALAFVQQLQADLRGIEATMQAILAPDVASAVDAFNAAINYALDDCGRDEAVTFLGIWREGGWEELREGFPDFKGPFPGEASK